MEKLRQFNTSGYIWETNNISIEGGEVKEISLDNSKPNMFVLQNANPVDINISLSHIPTLYNYEFQVKANTTDTFGRPSSTTKVYLFNTGSVTANVKLFSVNDTFDMNILKNTNVNNAITQINNNLSTQKTTTANIYYDTTAISSNSLNIARVLGVTKGCTIEYKNKVDTLTINNSNSSTKIIHFSYLFNDSCDVDIKVGSNTLLTVLAGEQLGDLEFEVPASQSLTVVKSATATAEDTVNIRCKYFTYASI